MENNQGCLAVSGILGVCVVVLLCGLADHNVAAGFAGAGLVLLVCGGLFAVWAYYHIKETRENNNKKNSQG